MSSFYKVALSIVATTMVENCSCSHTGLEGDGESDADDATVDGDGIWADYSHESDSIISDGPWDPEIENMGEPGWRDSEEPLCPPTTDMVVAYDVWSDINGIFVIIADSDNEISPGEDMNHLYYNDGSGWTIAYEELSSSSVPDCDTTCFNKIMGIQEGPLYLWGSPWPDCKFAAFEDGTLELQAYNSFNLFTINDTYAVACTDIGLMHNDGGTWIRQSTETEKCVGNDMWANETHVFVADNEGVVDIFDGIEWITHDVGIYSDIYSIWGNEDDDIWAGTEGGIVARYNGHSWSITETTVSGAVLGMWGDTGYMFLHTEKELLMWDGVEISIVGYMPSNISIQAIWGNSSTEVFLAVTDYEHITEDCGPEHLLYWDGHEFHWF